jgi:hypothetical protein
VNNHIDPKVIGCRSTQLLPSNTVPKVSSTSWQVLPLLCFRAITNIFSFRFRETKPSPHDTKINLMILTHHKKTNIRFIIFGLIKSDRS